MTKAKRTRYTDEFRASAVVILQANGYPSIKGALEKTSKALEVPHNTLSNWYNGKHNPPPTKLRQIKKRELQDVFDSTIPELVDALIAKKGEASFKDIGVVIGILVDKRQLLKGQPTQNVAVGGALSKEEITALASDILSDEVRKENRRTIKVGKNGLPVVHSM